MPPTSALSIAIALLAAVALPGFNIPDSEPSRVRHVLDRLAFGPTAGDVERVGHQGVENYIQSQLNDTETAEPPALQDELGRLEALNTPPAELFDRYGANKKDLSETKRKQLRESSKRLLDEAARARLLRAIHSPHQLREVMVDFWFNHFNVFADKGPLRLWVGNYENQAIRPYALGHFRDLLGATAHHPAMMYYLDNWQSSGRPKPPKPKAGKPTPRSGLNENYARELMELHTLGVGGGYSQQDVIELARILTGWGFLPKPYQSLGAFQFAFTPNRHDGGAKTLLGVPFAPGGQDEGERALDLLVAQPATAQHIARQLAQYFVADDPPPALVDGVAAQFQMSHGDIKATLDALFHRPEFWDPRYQGAKFKTPFEFVVSASRALGPLSPPPAKLQQALRQFGQPLFGYPTPDGYKNTQGAWLSPDAMNRRITFSIVAAAGRMGQVDFPKQGIDPQALALNLGQPFGERSRAAIAQGAPQLRVALMLGSPEFNHR